jgi:hypothetical protein
MLVRHFSASAVCLASGPSSIERIIFIFYWNYWKTSALRTKTSQNITRVGYDNEVGSEEGAKPATGPRSSASG